MQSPKLHRRKLRQKTREWIDYHEMIVATGFNVAEWAMTFPGRLIFAELKAIDVNMSHAIVCVGTGEFA